MEKIVIIFYFLIGVPPLLLSQINTKDKVETKTKDYWGLLLSPSIGSTLENVSSFSSFGETDKPSFAIDVEYSNNKFGIGLAFNSFQFSASRSDIEEVISKLNLDRTGNFQNTLTTIDVGPILKLGSKKINLSISPRIGIGDLESFRLSGSYIDPQSNQELQIINTERENKSNLFSGLETKISFSISDNIKLFVQGKYMTNRLFGAEKHMVSYTNPEDYNMDGVYSYEEIVNSPKYVLDCGVIDPMFVGVGISIGISPRKNKKEKEPLLEVFPPVPTFPIDTILCLTEKNGELRFTWNPEKEKLKGTNYKLNLFKVLKENRDSLIYYAKIEGRFEHVLQVDSLLKQGSYYWQIQGVDAKEISDCANDCMSVVTEFEVGCNRYHSYYLPQPKPSLLNLIVKNSLRFELPLNLKYSDKINYRIEDRFGSTVQKGFIPKNKEEESSNGLLIQEMDGYYKLSTTSFEMESIFTLILDDGKRSYYLNFTRANTNNKETNNEN